MTIMIFLVIIICAYHDLRRKRIPLVLVGVCAVLSLVEMVIAVTDHVRTPMTFLVAVLPGLFMLVLAFLTKKSVGYGDGLLMCAVGPVLGLRLMVGGLMLAFFFSSIFAIFLLVFKKADKKTTIPFIPFLASAMGVMIFVM